MPSAADKEKPKRRNKGQRPETRRKYREAIEACDSMEYIDLNISQIAALFHLNATALGNQLRAHYPDIVPRRERERHKRGIADNLPRGVRPESEENYEPAVRLLRDSDYTIEQAADMCNVSYPGLRQHIIFYHKDVEQLRDIKRRKGKRTPRTGTVSGTGAIRQVKDDVCRKYAEGVRMYRDTSLPITEIAKRVGVNVNSFRHHLRTWHKALMFERRGEKIPPGASDRADFGDTKRYDKSVAEKYADAINLLKTQGNATDLSDSESVKVSENSVESVAKRFGFTPEVFRAYLKEHEPELFASLGMVTLPNGRQVLRRSYEKYRPAIEAYSKGGTAAVGQESLRAIAARLGLPYKSLSSFIRRNFPNMLTSRRLQ